MLEEDFEVLVCNKKAKIGEIFWKYRENVTVFRRNGIVVKSLKNLNLCSESCNGIKKIEEIFWLKGYKGNLFKIQIEDKFIVVSKYTKILTENGFIWIKNLLKEKPKIYFDGNYVDNYSISVSFVIKEDLFGLKLENDSPIYLNGFCVKFEYENNRNN